MYCSILNIKTTARLLAAKLRQWNFINCLGIPTFNSYMYVVSTSLGPILGILVSTPLHAF